jgi:hypothetical protein
MAVLTDDSQRVERLCFVDLPVGHEDSDGRADPPGRDERAFKVGDLGAIEHTLPFQVSDCGAIEKALSFQVGDQLLVDVILGLSRRCT